jgi:hypothetical protein
MPSKSQLLLLPLFNTFCSCAGIILWLELNARLRRSPKYPRVGIAFYDRALCCMSLTLTNVKYNVAYSVKYASEKRAILKPCERHQRVTFVSLLDL